MNNKLYKIRNLDGKFSVGGTNPYFSRTGNTWRIGPLKNHLRQVVWKYYEDCQLVEFELKEIRAVDINKEFARERLMREL